MRSTRWKFRTRNAGHAIRCLQNRGSKGKMRGFRKNCGAEPVCRKSRSHTTEGSGRSWLESCVCVRRRVQIRNGERRGRAGLAVLRGSVVGHVLSTAAFAQQSSQPALAIRTMGWKFFALQMADRVGRTPYSRILRDTSVTNLLGDSLSDSVSSQFRNPEMTSGLPFINAR